MEDYRRHVERRSRTAGTLPVRLALMGPGRSLTDASTTAMLDPFGSARNLYSNTDTHRKGLTQKTVDIFRDHGAAWRRANAGHVSLDQLKVMTAIERCRTAALGGHVARCEDCAHTVIAYNSCRNRHCPKCQGAAAREWMAARETELLPVPYFHVVFTLPVAIGDIAYHNKAMIYDLLFTASAETM